MANNNDPHYNTWGGKNNTWGNRNRKNQQNNDNNKEPKNNNTVIKLVIGASILLALSSTGLDPILETAGNLGDAFDFGKKVEQSANKSNSKSDNKSKNKNSKESDFNSVKSEVDIDIDDLEDILDYVSDVAEKKDIEVEEMDTVVIDYSAFKNSKNYQKKILDKLLKYDCAVTFVATTKDELEESEMQDEYDRVMGIIEENLHTDSDFKDISVNASMNTPNYGEMTVSVTYTK